MKQRICRGLLDISPTSRIVLEKDLSQLQPHLVTMLGELRDLSKASLAKLSARFAGPPSAVLVVNEMEVP